MNHVDLNYKTFLDKFRTQSKVRHGRENVKKKKAIGLQGKTDNFARASHFFVHFFVNTARLRLENA